MGRSYYQQITPGNPLDPSGYFPAQGLHAGNKKDISRELMSSIDIF